MALMRGVAEGAEVGVMRSYQVNGAAGAHQAVEFLHGANHVVEMFNHMDGGEPVKATVGERIGKAVEIGQNIRAAGGVAIKADGAGLLVNAAAHIEQLHPCATACCKHVSSVS